MKIKTVGVIGLGAMGVIYAHLFTQALGKEHVLVLADKDRVARYEKEGIYFNGQLCDFNYTDVAGEHPPVDLLLFAVKFGALSEAIESCRHLVGPDTVLLSILNGIRSEEVLSEAFGPENVVWCVAQKMPAKKEGNHATCTDTGELAIGVPAGQNTAALHTLKEFFDSIRFRYVLPADIRQHMWSKLLCNTGCNQAAMVFEATYRTLQQPGKPRDVMVSAMREVAAVAQAEGIDLSEKDVKAWCDILDGMDPDSEPSMRQDGKAHRKSEVELFAGTIIRLAKKHNIPVPTNEWLYQKVAEMESQY